MVSKPGNPDKGPSRAIPGEELRLLLAKLEDLREAGIFTAEQFEDERRRLLREAGAEEPQP